jgi:hypothetical protein
MINPLGLASAELAAIRELKAGMKVDPRDPIWHELEVIGLVESRTGKPRLTMRGRLYRID